MFRLSYLCRAAEHILWPESCPLCGALAVSACDACLDALTLKNSPRFLLDGGLFCEAATFYMGAGKDLVHRLKFGGRKRLGLAMGRAMGRCLAPPEGAAVIVPVPLHARSERGYNQSALLARGLAVEWGLGVCDVLCWTGRLDKQVGKSRAERAALPAGSIALCDSRGAENIGEGVCVIIVDDVLTTGSTMLEACRALRSAGVEVARTVVWARA